MKAIEAQTEERLPVWEALSEFFLDTELQPQDYEQIARKLAATKFTEDELEEILISEVCPVCRRNCNGAGEWVNFDLRWLKNEIAPRLGKGVKLRPLFIRAHRWMYERQWNKVRKLITEIRAK